ncbi:hypothetical protein GCM10023321_63890 [Pseudonocardia eucalypti]|uniref:NlpC/P60 domain-containing protein n=1 Tax=Pseudonocardia eucalypti TaxID=648755 RepID=A0ABP9QXM9_9PSEU|nr:cell wall-associated NlpC family hydrolase [Pseudonocardia eucalypti]
MIKACAAGLAGLAVLVILLAAAAGGVISAVLNPFTSGTNDQAGTNSPASCARNGQPIQPPGYTAEQVASAATIIRVGQQLGVPPQGWVIALAAALQESGLRNLNYGDRDSLGLFQQRPSQGWGNPDQIMNPDYAATQFYRHLLAVPGWERMSVTDAAQAVQRSATPGAYARHEPAARTLVTALAACTPAPPQPPGSSTVPPVAAPANPTNDAATGVIATVTGYARAQIGTPYVWGGDGSSEGGFDCSGLVHAAYQAAGINLPRTADTQFRAGPGLPPEENLQPGDLVFYRAPGAQKITHVALVTGGGKVVHAPDRSKLVEEVPLPRKDFAGATRPVTGPPVPAGTEKPTASFALPIGALGPS